MTTAILLGGIMQMSKTAENHGCPITEGQRHWSNRPLQAQLWPEDHLGQIPADLPKPNVRPPNALPDQRGMAGNDITWPPCG